MSIWRTIENNGKYAALFTSVVATAAAAREVLAAGPTATATPNQPQIKQTIEAAFRTFTATAPTRTPTLTPAPTVAEFGQVMGNSVVQSIKAGEKLISTSQRGNVLETSGAALNIVDAAVPIVVAVALVMGIVNMYGRAKAAWNSNGEEGQEGEE